MDNNNSNKTYLIIAVVIVGVIAVLLAYLTKTNKSTDMSVDRQQQEMMDSGTQPASGTDTTMENTPSDTMGVKEITVTGSNFSFSPKEINVNKGDKVRIIFKNSGGMHNLMLDEFSVATKTIKDGEQDTVEFVADKVGQFQYYCSVGAHRAMGMVGNLNVK